jgi:hypothetical protein
MRTEPPPTAFDLPRVPERPEDGLLVAAVREDVRQTLRMAWTDPGLEAAAQYPAFFAAAWSAIRPNVGRSFLLLARRLRDLAATSAASWAPHATQADLRDRLDASLSEEERRRVSEAARAVQVSTAKVQIVLHLLLRASRRERLGGTGKEEPPIRRGIPEWQRWMSILPTPDSARPILWEAKDRFGTPSSPPSLRPFARWPSALHLVWGELEPHVAYPPWLRAGHGIRRAMIAGVGSLPHSVDLQWSVLAERGFREDHRELLAETLEAYDDSMAGQTLAAALAWAALGGPELGPEG